MRRKPRKSVKNKLKYLQYIIGVLILGIILYRIDFKYAIATLKDINISLLIPVGLITLPQLFLKSLRWWYLLRMQGINYGILPSFITYAKGIYFGMITPGRSGELIKVMYLKNEKNVEVGEGFSGVLLDRFFDLYVLIIISMFSCLKFSVRQPMAWAFLIGAITFIPFVVIGIKVDRVRRFFQKILDNFLLKKKGNFLKGHVESFYYGVKKVSFGSLLISFLLTLCAYSIFFIQCYFLSRLINLNLSFPNVIFISSIASLVAVLPISVLGIGTRDATIVYFFSKVNIAAASAIVYSFLMFFSFYIIGAVTGFLCWNIKPRRPKPEGS